MSPEVPRAITSQHGPCPECKSAWLPHDGCFRDLKAGAVMKRDPTSNWHKKSAWQVLISKSRTPSSSGRYCRPQSQAGWGPLTSPTEASSQRTQPLSIMQRSEACRYGWRRWAFSCSFNKKSCEARNVKCCHPAESLSTHKSGQSHAFCSCRTPMTEFEGLGKAQLRKAGAAHPSLQHSGQHLLRRGGCGKANTIGS